MPNAVPADAAARLPEGADDRSARSSIRCRASRPSALIVAFLTGTVWLVALALLSIGVSAAFGLTLFDLRRGLAADREDARHSQGRAGARVPAALRRRSSAASR